MSFIGGRYHKRNNPSSKRADTYLTCNALLNIRRESFDIFPVQLTGNQAYFAFLLYGEYPGAVGEATDA